MGEMHDGLLPDAFNVVPLAFAATAQNCTKGGGGAGEGAGGGNESGFSLLISFAA